MKINISYRSIFKKHIWTIKNIVFIIAFFLIAIPCQSLKAQYYDIQNDYISPVERYPNVANPNIYPKEVNTHYVVQKDILYGYAKGFYTSKSMNVTEKTTFQLLKEVVGVLATISEKRDYLPLHMDIYRSKKDEDEAKPVFLFVHGGGFFFGDKENDLQMELTKELVDNGFVVASINFRLGTKLRGYSDIKKGIYCCVQDVRSALRYLTYYADELKIDPDQIYLGGSSSGAIIALTTAFMDEDEVYKCCQTKGFKKRLGGINESGNSLTCNPKLAGVIALWGGINDLSMIDKRNNIPVLLFHGTKDNILYNESGIPFQEYLSSYLKNVLLGAQEFYGSYAIYKHMSAYNMDVRYVPFVDCKHAPHAEKDGSFNGNLNIVKQEINQFLFHNTNNLKHNINNGEMTLE
jgi:predicted esterase